MRETKDAHYLHARGGLEAVVSPPVEGATALDWLPQREELVVASNTGQLSLVDPVMGTRTIATGLGEPGAVAVDPEGQAVAVLVRGSGLEIRALSDGAVRGRYKAALFADLWVGWWKGGVAIAGEGLDGRQWCVFDAGGHLLQQGTLPKGACVGVGPKGGLLLGRVSAEGPEVIPLGKGELGPGEPTRHRLRFASGGVLLGVAEGGVTLWRGKSAPSRTVRCYGVTSAQLDPDGQLLAVGTRDGGVAVSLVEADRADKKQIEQKGGHEGAVTSIAFARQGRFLATAGEKKCWLWSF